MEDIQFAFLKAPLGGTVRYALSDGRLTERDADRVAIWEIALADVEAATYSTTNVGGLLARSLTLKTDHKNVTIGYSDRNPKDDEADGFVALIRAIGSGLEDAQPGFRVSLGQTKFQRFALFTAFAFAAVVAAGILFAMFLSNMGFDDVFAVAAPLAVLIVFGGLGMRMFWPWRPLPTIPAKRLLAPPPQRDTTPI